MQATPFAAPEPGEHASAHPAARDRGIVACLYAARPLTTADRDAVQRRLPAAARLVLAGACDAGLAAGQPERLADLPAGPTLPALLRAAAHAFPRADLLLIDADATLPPLACERLLHALGADGVLAALPLDGGPRNPWPASRAGAPAEHLDALCFAWSDRRLLPDAAFPADCGAISAWHGERLAALGPSRADDAEAIAAAGLRVVMLDHVYVPATAGVPARPPRPADGEAEPPSPLAPLRARLAALAPDTPAPAQPGLDGRPVLLHILHGWGGGAERWVRDYAAADASAQHLVLVARGRFRQRRHGEWLELHDGRLTGPPLRRWPLPRPIHDTALADSTWRALVQGVLRDCCVDAILVSSLIGHSLDALRTGLPTVCIVHDHYPLWPVLHRDFGDPALAFDAAQRAGDLAALGADAEFANRDPAHWLRLREATVAALLAARATLVAPSRAALASHLRLAPELAALPASVIGHGLAPWPAGSPAVPAPPARARLRLVVPGRVRRGKGAELLLAALPALRAHADIFLLGAGADAQALFGEAGVHLLLDYRREDLPTLLAGLRPDAALLLPTVAETFSYTLSEMRSLGVPVIATRVGALAERISDGIDGLLVAPNAQAVAERIAALAGERSPLDALRTRLAGAGDAASIATMARAYTGLLQLPARPAARYPLAGVDAPALERAALVSALARTRQTSRQLAAERDAAREESGRRGDWGHALDRELAALRQEYAHETQLARQRLDAVHAELEERTRWALALDAELQDVKPRYEQILASWSWRLTAPLRAANELRRRLGASLAFRARRFGAVGGRVRGSLARRGLAGTLARAGQELRGSGPARPLAHLAEPVDDATPFALPTHAQPRVSIIIPVYDKIAWTLACLRSIAEQAGKIPFEVIVVDDGSSDATPARLAGIGGLRTLRNAKNLGFIGSCNAGAAAARGEFVLFLNNDTVVTAGWLEALVHCIEHAPAAGLVGARLVYPDGRLQEAGGIVFNDGSGWNYGRFEDPTDPRFSFRREVDYCSGAAILLRRELFERLGRFDTRYAPAYYEDTDLAFAVRAAGLKVYVEPAATVIHFEGVTSGTDTASGAKRYQVVNQGKFRDKWQQALAQQPAPGTPIGLAASHRARRRVLVIDATTPAPDQDSGSLRLVNLMRVLGDLGCQVSFLPENRAFVETYTPALQALGIEALYAPHAQDPVRLLRERGGEFDFVILSRHYVAASFVGLVRLYAPQARLAFDTVDLHYLREQRAAELADSAELRRVAAATRTQELKIIREADMTLVVSPVEQALLARDAPGARVEVLSNVHEVHGCKAPWDARRDLVFVGGFQHPPNADAVEWFVTRIFPTVRAALAGVRFHIIGSKLPETIRRLADEAVIVHGFVPDIMPYMDGCRVSVAPLRYGAGVKGKVNMAMSCGLPVVATPIAVEGMHVEAGRDVLVAEDADAFAAEVIRLYRDEALWNTLSAHGLANVERHFSFAAARRVVAGLLDLPA